MSMRMLIDARHREETRVAVVKGNRVEEFDFESEEHKQLKGNIYLAKVTRVEPSLQAAFVDYGGNRHGFLAFSEIHPDYYQIPKEDREALLREEAEHAAEEEALRARDYDDEDGDEADDHDDEHEPARRETLDSEEDYEGGEEEGDRPAPKPTSTKSDDSQVESLRQRRMNLRRRYKIQDVIRRRQVLLVQVVKEERGNKGAALTTYLSLAGRYCVLMPNTSHGGGISRKISNAGDRKRLKSIMAELNLPQTMGCIVRTAGLQRTRQEIKRDFDYLARLWDGIRETTLKSEAPAEVYRDSDLIKRAIRDIYNKDIDEVIVEGEEGYHAARSFMKLLMPAHAKKIAPYSDAVPLFQRFGVEDQLAAMYQPVVQLKSGGYLVINPTEALVSIDINSGRSTREHNIEQTATATNLEAAAEIARQLRLRDMAGLVVIDFIDMENHSNNRKVERAMKEALKNDRARIQVGRISGFGLFEMSRQRLRTGVLEASTRICPHCEGTGFVRTASSSGLHALRLIEEEAARGRGCQIRLRASQEATLYVLNRKRTELFDIEDRYGVQVEVVTDGTLEGARMLVESGGPPPAHAPRLPTQIEREPDEEIEDEIEEEEEIVAESEDRPARNRGEGRGEGDRGERGEGRGRRRRRRRGGRREEGEGFAAEREEGTDQEAVVEPQADAVAEGEVLIPEETAGEGGAGEGGEGRRRRGRRGRRGGRGRSGAGAPENGIGEEAIEAVAEAVDVETLPITAEPEPAAEVSEEAPKRRSRRRKADAVEASEASDAIETGALPAELPVAPAEEPFAEEAPKPRRRSRKAAVDAVAPEAASEAPVETPAAEAEPAPAPKRRSRKAAAAVIEAAPVDEPAVEAPVEAAVVETAEPVVEPATSDEGSSETPRRGWWQRTFGN